MKIYTKPTAKFHKIIPNRMLAGSDLTVIREEDQNATGTPTTPNVFTKRGKIDLFSDDEEQ